MNKIVKIIHQTWKTQDVPDDDYPRVWQESWRKRNPDWEYRLWTDDDNERLVRDHYPAYYDIYRRIRRGVVKSDFARLLYLHKYGGIYADLDYICLRPMDDFIRVGYAIAKAGRESCTMLIDSRPFGKWPRVFCNAFMYSCPMNWSLIRIIEDGLMYYLQNQDGVECDHEVEIAFGSIRITWLENEFGQAANFALMPPGLACPYHPFIHDRGDAGAFSKWRDMDFVEREFEGSYAVSSWRGGWWDSRWTTTGTRGKVAGC